eukprot:CAMPEP_0170413620 /NCGR_PEP_ID=MMETSP0117_2-20130122/31624_1 /TAXON_ID=400756 /ORGANISM="Durinskia baltica, Strain CSIRO CS-38" /LENGTH=193 /DNA_ID=CAMNT_0010671439 /DNA_START=17 /DNA_END=598 /DNA_ORIENTATION=-
MLAALMPFMACEQGKSREWRRSPMRYEQQEPPPICPPIGAMVVQHGMVRVVDMDGVVMVARQQHGIVAPGEHRLDNGMVPMHVDMLADDVPAWMRRRKRPGAVVCAVIPITVRDRVVARMCVMARVSTAASPAATPALRRIHAGALSGDPTAIAFMAAFRTLLLILLQRVLRNRGRERIVAKEGEHGHHTAQH